MNCAGHAQPDSLVSQIIPSSLRVPQLAWILDTYGPSQPGFNSKPEAVSQRENGSLEKTALLCSKILGFWIVLSYWNLTEAPYSIPICYMHLKYHYTCKWQCSLHYVLDLLQILLLLFYPLITSRLMGYHTVNGSKQYSQMWYTMPSKSSMGNRK